MNKRIVFNLNDIQGNKKEEEFKDMLKVSGVTLHENDNYADDNNFYGKRIVLSDIANFKED